MSQHPKGGEKLINIENPELKKLLNQSYSADVLNLKHTNIEKMKDVVISKLQSIQPFLREIGVESIIDINPEQASLMAGKIIADSLEYDTESILLEQVNEGEGEEFSSTRGRKVILKEELEAGGMPMPRKKFEQVAKRLVETQDMPIEELLTHWKMAVCRHYARAFIAVFDSLKAIQKGTQLQNTYVINSSLPGHAYNSLITIGENQQLSITAVDPTWADLNRLTDEDKRSGLKTGFQRQEFDQTPHHAMHAYRGMFKDMFFLASDRLKDTYEGTMSEYKSSLQYKLSFFNAFEYDLPDEKRDKDWRRVYQKSLEKIEREEQEEKGEISDPEMLIGRL